MQTKDDSAYSPWEEVARQVLVAEMKRKRVSYKQLSRLLESAGIVEEPGQLNRKVNRKTFSAAFLLACLAVLEADAVPLRWPKTES